MGDPRVGVVIPAGGSGSRMAVEGAPSKQFRELGGAPVFVQTLRAFARHPGVGLAVIAASASDLEDVVDHLIRAELDALVVEGGATRQDSVAAGVRALEGVEVVLVHDAVRPFISGSVIANVLKAVVEH
ncbi:2-C-methyl-D-erythritol 4-phosphate cytidylyltransferase, partial [Rubrivirga sp.]|uniref:2-C-methyl-D-erythritol 4-phosphate cytidylyltransferase n=1 Tax=Rubrivirga sp. TaxID=1885344 RepID=UPI003C744CA1